MAYQRLTWLPDVLRDAGIQVVLHPGWAERGLSTARPFQPRAVVWHHDASAPGDSPSVPEFMIGRFETAAAQVWIDRSGRWHLIASGRAPHAGAVLPGMPDNSTSIGIETDHTSGEAWPTALLSSLRAGTAAVLVHLGVSADDGLHFHKTICAPPGRKVDPAGLELGDERARVADLMKPAAATRLVVSLAAARRAARHRWIPLTTQQRRAVAVIKAALLAEGLGGAAGYARWQRRLGYRGNDADGVPGTTSLTALGNRHGFRVTR